MQRILSRLKPNHALWLMLVVPRGFITAASVPGPEDFPICSFLHTLLELTTGSLDRQFADVLVEAIDDVPNTEDLLFAKLNQYFRRCCDSDKLKLLQQTKLNRRLQ